jgi:hypothetical protein
MRALASTDIESELSYAYLHAVAAHAGMECVIKSRHSDNNGVDAAINAWPTPAGDDALSEVSINIQLKATIDEPADNGTHLSYFLKGVSRYNDLRERTIQIPRILVVLFLPKNAEEWLNHTPEQLTLKRCAYWLSLREAPPTGNDSGVTVKIAKTQMFTPKALADLVDRVSRGDFPVYSIP